MDFSIHSEILNGLREYMEMYSIYSDIVSVVEEEPLKPSYPVIIVSIPRNTPTWNRKIRIDKVYSIGIKVDIYAKQIKGNTRTKVMQDLAQEIESYLTLNKLQCVSFNDYDFTGTNGVLRHGIMMFTADYLENRKEILL